MNRTVLSRIGHPNGEVGQIVGDTTKFVEFWTAPRLKVLIGQTRVDT
ncbi:MAG TPA: hypothetical protein VMF10_09695 [Candidatus Aquilonibacter sp.]|nr:hypothetical protein [Candidatus Aquilonibacter sp.]